MFSGGRVIGSRSVFIAVDLTRSGLRVLHRCQAQHRDIGYGRYIPQDLQRAVFEGILATADRIDHDAVVDGAHVFRHGGDHTYTRLQPGLRQGARVSGFSA